MSARRYYTIWCDALATTKCRNFIETGEGTAERARAIAKQEGWTVGLHGGRDLCPQHDRLLEVSDE